jgi:hypothetical protein
MLAFAQAIGATPVQAAGQAGNINTPADLDAFGAGMERNDGI